MGRIHLNGYAGNKMFKKIKESWKKIQNDPPGKRFRRQYRRRKKARKSIAGKIILLLLGVLVVAVGIVMLPAPGPGTLVVFLGLGLIAQESLWLSILLDKFELKLRSLFEWSLKWWKQAHIISQIIVVLIALVLAAVFTYAMYWYFFIR
jgi:uncharacterized protein (TIGR02611 family)